MPGGAGEVAGEQSDASGYTTAVQGYWQLMWEEEKDSRSREDGGGGVSEKGIEKHMSYSGGGRGIIYGYTKIYENVGFFS